MKIRHLFLGAAAVLAAAAALVLASPAVALNGLAAVNSLRVAHALAYGSLPRQRYDLYRPASAAPPGGWPLVVFFYGGAWNRGERADYRFVGEALAARGMLVMVADYRLHPEVKYPEFLHDCAQATAHALGQARSWGADDKRIYLMGHSAGAYNVAMLALDARWLAPTGHSARELAGWIGLAGPYDFLPIKTPEVQAAFHHPNVPPDSQPLRHIAPDAAVPGVPALLIVGAKDQRIDPVRNTRGLAIALREAGTAVRLREYDGLSHETAVAALAWPLQRLAPVLDEVADFVQASAPLKTFARR
ncbi:alpha/beta hydrolase [Aquabacterium sp.]|uniref:alpha/beta hydrolase n=1 Tax=Aquabacterium sp. TaxID=1872578 RepID=UPI002BD044F6|nr:alpha/beta hydrolase [Aquabacterium sp.]HSW08951.1 alpha/beta hydrolase [Aquabacterium sp.]